MFKNNNAIYLTLLVTEFGRFLRFEKSNWLKQSDFIMGNLIANLKKLTAFFLETLR